MLLSIDPGGNTGWALFDEFGTLIACGLDAPRAGHVDDVVIEHPRIYPNGKTGDPNAIVKLAINAGEHAGMWRVRGARITYVEPRTWKGTLDADVCQRRVWARLTPFEVAVGDTCAEIVGLKPGKDVPFAGRGHNMVDAVGLGLYQLGRWTIKPADFGNNAADS